MTLGRGEHDFGSTVNLGEARGFDVFLSHNRRDRHAVERIAVRLKHAGLEPWLDAWCGTPGGDWQEEMADGLARSSACAVFIGRHDLGGWERLEVAVALDRSARERGFRVFPVLLPGLEPFDPNSLPPFLSTRTWVNFRPGLDSSRALQELVFAVKGVSFGPDALIESRDEVCPYRGLSVFEEEDAEFFFGREGDVQRLLERLKTSRLLAVLGPSGSGKSSLVRAGLVPGLRAGGVLGSEAWTIRVMRPGAEPLSALAAQLLSLSAEQGMQATVDALARDQRTLHLGTALALVDRPPESRVAFVIDQLEEVFTLCRDSTSRARFFDNLCYAAAAPSGRAVVILTMRADFYPRLVEHPILAQLMQADQVLVGTLRGEGLRQVIEEPAHRVGVEFESGLSDTILGDVSGRPGVLPLLEHALLETWRRRRGHMLTLEGYRDSGGVHRAVSERAEALYTSLGPDEQAIARSVLLRLTQPGDGTEDTRRRVRLGELVGYEHDGEAVEGVVRRFVDARLLTTSGEDASDKTWVEVAHEALIRGWPRLRQWIEADRTGLRIHRSLTAAAADWQRLGADRGALYAGAQLAEAIAWHEHGDRGLNALERDFLTASRDRERRSRAMRRRRTKVAFVGLAIALAAITAVALVAVDRGRDAIQQRDLAQSRQLAASATTLLAADPSLSLSLARRALATAETDQAGVALREATLQYRGLQVLRADTGWVYDAAFSPDGRRAVSAGEDGRIRLWRISDGRRLATIKGHRGAVRSARFSPNGRLIASAGEDGKVAVASADGRRQRVVLHISGTFAMSVAFSPDGRRLAAGFSDGTIRVVPVTGRRGGLRVRAHTGSVFRVAFSPDGRRVLSAGEDGRARAWDASHGAPLLTLPAEHGAVLSAEYDRDGRRILTAGDDGRLRIWDARNGSQMAEIQADEQAVFAAGFSPDGARVVGASEDGVTRVWDSDGGPALASLRRHGGQVFAASFSPKMNLVMTAGADGTIRTWDPGRRLVLRAAVVNVNFSQDARRLVTGGTDGVVRIWDTQSGRLRSRLSAHALPSKASFSGDGRRVVSSSEDGTVRIWRLSTGKMARVLRPHQGAVWSAAFDPTGRRIVSGGDDRRVVITRLDRHEKTVLRGHSYPVYKAMFSANGRHVLSTGEDGTLRIWDAQRGGKPLQVWKGHKGAIYGAAYSPDGRRVVSAGVDGTVRVWSLEGGHTVILRGHEGAVWSVAFGPDGDRVVSAGIDGTVRVWDANGGESLVVLHQHRSRAASVAFSPVGNLVASAGDDRTIRLSPCEVCGPLAEVERLARLRADRQLTPLERERFLAGAR